MSTDSLDPVHMTQEIAPLKTEMVGTLKVEILPSNSGQMAQKTFSTTAERLIGRDPRRHKVTLIAKTNIVQIACTQVECDASVGFELPTGVVLVLTHEEEVWARAITGTAVISYVHELWAT